VADRQTGRSNSRAARRALAQLRSAERLDSLGELIGVALITSAGLLDDTMAPGSDCAPYAAARVLQAHCGTIDRLCRWVGDGETDEDSPFTAWLDELAKPGAGSTDNWDWGDASSAR
jgi:hypothetical protein